MIFIDSNIWIYYLSRKAPEHTHVKEKMREILLGEEILSNTSIVLEIAHYFRYLAKRDFKKIISFILGLSNLRLVPVDRELSEQSIRILERYAQQGVGSRDATILAAMHSARIKRIATHDMVFKRLGFLDVIDPIP